VMPERMSEMWRQLGEPGVITAHWSDALVWGRLAAGTQTHPGEPLFPRIEVEVT
jgi:methionyl-tRNA synthetase